jgi:GT2 family glycosyltransferase
VVPTYRRNALLKRCLDALLKQNFDPTAYEIIVVDDAASEETRQLVEAIASERPALRYVPMLKHQGPAAARNAGWRTARGKIIAFTDDDTIPDPNWLAAGITAFADDPTYIGQPVHAVTGKIVVPLPRHPTDYEKNAAGLENAEFATANCFFRRDVLAAIDGFDEKFKMAFREDSDAYFTLLENGGRVMYCPQAIVTHPVRPAAWGVSLKQQAKSEYDALLYKKHPALYRRSIQPKTPWNYYGVIGALLAALAGWRLRRAWLTLGAMSVWVWLTGTFAARRLKETARAPSHLAEMIVTSILIPPVAVYWRLTGAIRHRVRFL